MGPDKTILIQLVFEMLKYFGGKQACAIFEEKSGIVVFPNNMTY